MSPVNVLVIFSSLHGSTEKLALAAAVGAVQARANIRLRRLAEPGEDAGEIGEALARMRKEYVSPTQVDVLWADAVIIGMNGKIAGITTDATGATAYARKITTETRQMKSEN